MRLKELATKYELPLESLQFLIHDFGIDLNFCFTENFKVSDAFEAFMVKHMDFIAKYAKDKSVLKDIKTIAETIGVDEKEVSGFFTKNGVAVEQLADIRTNISSFQIHLLLGGDYDFIFKDLPAHKFDKDSLVGYADLFFYHTDRLDPFINEEQVKLWGISRPAGILLYGPPGSGKIFWARRIAEMIGYEFIHVYRDYLIDTTKSDNNQFTTFLLEKMNQSKTLLFIENFEELMSRDSPLYSSPESIELINMIFRHIQNDRDSELVIVGSVEVLSKINEEITAPGRFDLQIPVFPPTSEERPQLIHYHLTKQLVAESPLLHILAANNANNPDFWRPLTHEMKLFSNTMLIDFTQSLKKRLYVIHRKNEQKEIQITTQLIQASLNEVKAKLTMEYLQSCYTFIMEAKQNVEMEFPHRFLELQHELEFYTKKVEPIEKIGFKTSAEKTNLIEK